MQWYKATFINLLLIFCRLINWILFEFSWRQTVACCRNPPPLVLFSGFSDDVWIWRKRHKLPSIKTTWKSVDWQGLRKMAPKNLTFGNVWPLNAISLQPPPPSSFPIKSNQYLNIHWMVVVDDLSFGALLKNHVFF